MTINARYNIAWVRVRRVVHKKGESSYCLDKPQGYHCSLVVLAIASCGIWITDTFQHGPLQCVLTRSCLSRSLDFGISAFVVVSSLWLLVMMLNERRSVLFQFGDVTGRYYYIQLKAFTLTVAVWGRLGESSPLFGTQFS